MASVDGGDGDLSVGSYPSRLGIQKRKRQEKIHCDMLTRSLLLKQKLEEKKLSKKKAETLVDDDGSRTMTLAELKIYTKQVQKTGGFDIDVPPEVCDCGLICPLPNFDKNPWLFERVKRCAREAIDVYNNEYGEKFQFTRVVKLNSMMVVGFNHYITFEAKDKDAALMCFQALVYAGIHEDEIEVKFCRPKPKS